MADPLVSGYNTDACGGRYKKSSPVTKNDICESYGISTSFTNLNKIYHRFWKNSMNVC